MPPPDKGRHQIAEFNTSWPLILTTCAALANVVVLAAGGETGDRLSRIFLATSIILLAALLALLGRHSGRPDTKIESAALTVVSETKRLLAHETETAILLRALEVFGDSDRALEWMRESNPALKKESPIRAIQTEAGRQEVLDILVRIRHGVIS
ncbi:MAG: hypothetical protein JWP63_5622 [Candidatus Solibacter sp.]|nr:hypothetical protein [Candidatus Solibacter sp.]